MVIVGSSASFVVTLRSALASSRSNAYAGLAGVVRGDLAQRRVGDRDLVVGQRRPLPLPRQQVVAGDGNLVVLGVAVDIHQLHAVQQRQRD